MIDWELQIKHAGTGVWTDVPFESITLGEKSGVDISGMTVTVGDKAGYYFSWIKDCSELKVLKNGMEHFYGYITDIGERAGSKGEDIKIAARNYWHYILKRRLTTFERFGKIGNINPTELAKVAIGIKTYISDADWEADKINALKFGSISTDTAGDVKLKLGVRNNTQYTLMAYLRSVQWRVDEPDWQGSEDMKDVTTTVSETLSGGDSDFFYSRDDGDLWYHLTKSAKTSLTGSETVKNKGKYKISLWGLEAKDENLVYLGVTDKAENLYEGNPNTQQIVRTKDGTLHTCIVRDVDKKTAEHWVSRDNGKEWNKWGNSLATETNDIISFCIAVSPYGHLGILVHQTGGNVKFYLRRIDDKTKAAWTWDTSYAVSASVDAAAAGTISMNGVRLHNGTAWEEGFAYVWRDSTGGGVDFAFYTAPDTGVPVKKWATNLETGAGYTDQPVIWCHSNWGQGASSKRVMFVARAAVYGSTRTTQIKYATYTSGGSPSWSGSWVIIDSGACYGIDMVSDRVKHDFTDEDYNIYVWFVIANSLYCKYSSVDDLSTWTTLSGGAITGIVNDRWDVSHLVDKNFIVTDSNTAIIWREFGGYDTPATSLGLGNSPKIAQESIEGFGDILLWQTSKDLYSNILYSTVEPYITAMSLNVTTDSETGILEGNLTSYVNPDLTAEEVDYNMNRESRLNMLQNIQKLMPVSSGSSSPYPFWDMEIRVEGGVAYLDIAEQLGSVKEVTIAHEDEVEGDLLIKILNKTIDRGEIINALTIVGGGWSSGGIEVIPTKNVATAGVVAGTGLQLAGTIMNKRTSTNLTIENIAYGVLNVTKSPRITIGLEIKGDARNLFTLNDRITVISERADINETLKVRGMNWNMSKGKTKLTLTLDNGAQTLDKYMVEVVSNLNSIGFKSQGELTRPPIFLNKNFSRFQPATLNFYVPSSRKTIKAIIYVKTQKYISYENSAINEFGYYPSDVKLLVDDIIHEGFGGRGTETTPVDINGMDITTSLDLDVDGFVDNGEHRLKFVSSKSANNPNGIGKVEAYLVLLESET